MSVPNYIDDGNWNQLIPMEGSVIEFPFSDQGDNISWKQTIPYRINRLAYRPRSSMSLVQGLLGIGYLTKLGTVHEIGSNLVQFEDTIMPTPQTRIVPTSFAYTYQWWRGVTEANVDASKYFYNVNFDIEEQTFTVLGHIKYEYFANVEPQPFIKPRVFLLFGFLQSIGGTPILGNNLVAEDSAVSILEGKIYERRTIYVKVNSTGQLVA